MPRLIHDHIHFGITSRWGGINIGKLSFIILQIISLTLTLILSSILIIYNTGSLDHTRSMTDDLFSSTNHSRLSSTRTSSKIINRAPLVHRQTQAASYKYRGVSMYVASREVRPNECRTIKCLSIHSGDRTNVYILHLIHSYLFEHV